MKDKACIKWYDELDSTNSEAQRHISDIDNLSVIAAVNQTAGRGQRGNSWLVHPGENLTFSLVYKPQFDLPATRQFDISRATTAGICEYLRGKGVSCRIKWPNDIYVRSKKVCGILIENTLSAGNVASSIIGIGLNVNQKEFPPTLVNPSSMTLVTGKTYVTKDELPELCGCLVGKLEMLESPEGTAMLREEYQSLLYQVYAFHDYFDCLSQERITARIIDTTESGLLRVETKKGELKEFAFKEISYII